MAEQTDWWQRGRDDAREGRQINPPHPPLNKGEIAYLRHYAAFYDYMAGYQGRARPLHAAGVPPTGEKQ